MELYSCMELHPWNQIHGTSSNFQELDTSYIQLDPLNYSSSCVELHPWTYINETSGTLWFVGSTLADGSIGRGFESEHCLFKKSSISSTSGCSSRRSFYFKLACV